MAAKISLKDVSPELVFAESSLFGAFPPKRDCLNSEMSVMRELDDRVAMRALLATEEKPEESRVGSAFLLRSSIKNDLAGGGSEGFPPTEGDD
jgi:hypothetical protein